MAVHSESTRASDEKSENEAHGVIIHKLGGAENLVKLPPTFSNDAKHVFIVSGTNIRVYSTQSGSQTLLLQGHEENVVGVQVGIAGNELLSMDASGKLVTWDYLTGQRKSDFHWGQVVPRVYESFHIFMGEMYAFLRSGDKESKGAVYHLQASKTARRISRDADSMNGIAFGCNGGNTGVVALLGRDHVLVKDIKHGYDKKHMTDARTFTCVALHATEMIMATGDISGRVIVWYDFLKHNRPPKTVYHWHTLPVSALAFSEEGSFLFSGGAENTLVKWTLRSNMRSFLPRMGSPIAHVVNAPDNVYVATSHVDNAIRLVDKTNKIQRSILGLVKHDGKQVLPAGLVYDPRSRGVYLNGLIGHLQLFDVASETLIFNLDITNRNIITDERNRAAGNVDVMKVAVSHTGQWLATVEAWSITDNQLQSEVQLKFWKFDETVQNFSLNTSVTTPHHGHVTSIAFQPGQDDPCFVSIGSDKKFKIWRLTEEDDVYSKRSVSTWFCDSVGEFRGLAPHCIGFSEDGSLLAIGFGNLVTVWDPLAVQLKTTLSHSLLDEPLEFCLFGREQCCHLLVCATKKAIFAWNVLTLTLSWTVKLPASLVTVVADTRSSYMAAVLENSDVIVFSPASSKPVQHSHCVCQSVPRSAVFVPRFNALKQATEWLRESRLLLVDQDREMYSLDDISGERYEARRQNALVENLPFTPFAALKAQRRIAHTTSIKPVVHATQGIRGFSSVHSLLENPASTLPPMTRLCEPFLASLLTRHQKPSDAPTKSILEEKMETLTVSTAKKTKSPETSDRGETDFRWLVE